MTAYASTMLDPQKLDILSLGPIVEGMINQQTMFVYPWRGHVNRNIVGYNKYLLVITVVA